jgi:hypothetical protein
MGRNGAGMETGASRRCNSLILDNFSDCALVARRLQTRLPATNREEAMTMKIAEKFEQVMMAAAFAEENEHATARELLAVQRETERAAQRPTTRPQPRQTLRAD